MARKTSWLTLGLDTWLLGLDAASVVALRGAKIAVGGAAAHREIATMVAEKMASALTLQSLASTTGVSLSPQAAAAKTLTHLRSKVGANRRRLAKKTPAPGTPRRT